MKLLVMGLAAIMVTVAGSAAATPVKCIDFQARLEDAAKASGARWPSLQWRERDGVIAIANLPDIEASYLCEEGLVSMFSTTREMSKGASVDFGTLQTAAIVGIGAFDDWMQALAYQQSLLKESVASFSQQATAGKRQAPTKQTINGYDVKFGVSKGVRFFTLEKAE